MVQVIVGNNVKRETVVVSPETTLRTVLEENGIDYARGVMHLDGASLKPGDLDSFTPEQVAAMEALAAQRREEIATVYEMVAHTSK